MAVRKLNGRYVVEFELRGHRVFRRLPTGATKGQAQELETRLRGELIDQSILGRDAVVPLDKAIAGWLEEVVVKPERRDKKETTSKANLVMAEVKGLALTKAGIVAAAEKVRQMGRVRGEGAFSPATVNRRLSILKGTAKWAWKVKHWTRENLSPYVILLDKKLEKARDRTLDPKTFVRLLKHAPNFESEAFIALGALTLMRQGEVMKRRPEDVSKGIKIKARKTGQTIVIPVVPQLRPYLKALPLKHHKRTLYGWFEEARDKAGIQDLVYHDLRRTGATILLNEGIPLEVVAAALGDSLEVARKHYAHVLDRTLVKAFNKGFKPIKIPSGRGGPGGI